MTDGAAQRKEKAIFSPRATPRREMRWWPVRTSKLASNDPFRTENQKRATTRSVPEKTPKKIMVKKADTL